MGSVTPSIAGLWSRRRAGAVRVLGFRPACTLSQGGLGGVDAREQPWEPPAGTWERAGLGSQTGARAASPARCLSSTRLWPTLASIFRRDKESPRPQRCAGALGGLSQIRIVAPGPGALGLATACIPQACAATGAGRQAVARSRHARAGARPRWRPECAACGHPPVPLRTSPACQTGPRRLWGSAVVGPRSGAVAAGGAAWGVLTLVCGCVVPIECAVCGAYASILVGNGRLGAAGSGGLLGADWGSQTGSREARPRAAAQAALVVGGGGGRRHPRALAPRAAALRALCTLRGEAARACGCGGTPVWRATRLLTALRLR